MIEKIIYSSKDINKISLTLKAGVPFLMLFGVSKYVSTEQATGLIDMTTNLIILIGELVTGLIAFYGAARKIYLNIIDK